MGELEETESALSDKDISFCVLSEALSRLLRFLCPRSCATSFGVNFEFTSLSCI